MLFGDSMTAFSWNSNGIATRLASKCTKHLRIDHGLMQQCSDMYASTLDVLNRGQGDTIQKWPFSLLNKY